MIRQVVSEVDVAASARRGAARIRRLADEWGEPNPLRERGSLLLGHGEGWDDLLRMAGEAASAGLAVEPLAPPEVVRRVPVLEGAVFDGALWTPSDGVVEVGSLLNGYLAEARAAGVSVRCQEKVVAIRPVRGGGFQVETETGEVQAEIVVNAAGAWANSVGSLAGAGPLPLRPCRRHLFHTGPLPFVDADWPFVWNISSGLYFRPETGGLLLSPGDEVEHEAADVAVDPGAEGLLAEKVAQGLPGMPDLPVRRGWAGLRTLTSDGRFIIGWDMEVAGFFWVAGLGGHGVTCSYDVGRLAAELILSGTRNGQGPFSPSRFESP